MHTSQPSIQPSSEPTANQIECGAFNAAFLAEMRSLVRMRDFVRRSIVPWLVKDHPVHRYFLAAKQTEFAVGGATGQLLRIGRELADTPV